MQVAIKNPDYRILSKIQKVTHVKIHDQISNFIIGSDEKDIEINELKKEIKKLKSKVTKLQKKSSDDIVE